ncbi:hypothetical protein QAD02_015519 [Eretmocerus hayati]|uniref:Uncharacterized protein n=1 Tax=Eretmocerus hayati TaxID=131215 RepID=A0ACC2P8U8_9HYME|nr:hypothetical protein QAD02_015519 [Eretmocerus hayati]
MNELERVDLQADVYMACMQHALSTENYEVMGLLIGDNKNGVTEISASIVLRRSDKKKDRVEISTDQLLHASSEAERLAQELERNMRVVGWYHSHPHITVFPSHVDVGTQAMYQTMDSSFVGLIFSVFNEDKATKEQEILLTCFQSVNGKAKEIPLKIIPTPQIARHCFQTMVGLSQILIQEEQDMAKGLERHPDFLTSIHNVIVQTKALGHVTDIVTRPLVQVILDRYKTNKSRLRHLQQQLAQLKLGNKGEE